MNKYEKVKKNKENEEIKEENMDNLRTIAENLVDYFYKYEEALEAGIKKALEIILEK